MIRRNIQLNLKTPRNFGVGKIVPFVKNIFQNVLRFLVEFVTLWTRILKLAFKIFVLQFKVAILAQKRRVLLFQRRHLLREQRSLLVEKINHVFGKTRSSGNAPALKSGFKRACRERTESIHHTLNAPI